MIVIYVITIVIFSILFGSSDDYSYKSCHANYEYYENTYDDNLAFGSGHAQSVNTYDYFSTDVSKISEQYVSKKVAQYEDDDKSLFGHQSHHDEDEQADTVVAPKKLTKQQIKDLRDLPVRFCSRAVL